MLVVSFAFVILGFVLYNKERRDNRRLKLDLASALTLLGDSEHQRKLYIAENRGMRGELAARKIEQKLEVRATVTGPDSMNIAGGYRYPPTNS